MSLTPTSMISWIKTAWQGVKSAWAGLKTTPLKTIYKVIFIATVVTSGVIFVFALFNIFTPSIVLWAFSWSLDGMSLLKNVSLPLAAIAFTSGQLLHMETKHEFEKDKHRKDRDDLYFDKRVQLILMADDVYKVCNDISTGNDLTNWETDVNTQLNNIDVLKSKGDLSSLLASLNKLRRQYVLLVEEKYFNKEFSDIETAATKFKNSLVAGAPFPINEYLDVDKKVSDFIAHRMSEIMTRIIKSQPK